MLEVEKQFHPHNKILFGIQPYNIIFNLFFKITSAILMNAKSIPVNQYILICQM